MPTIGIVRLGVSAIEANLELDVQPDKRVDGLSTPTVQEAGVREHRRREPLGGVADALGNIRQEQRLAARQKNLSKAALRSLVDKPAEGVHREAAAFRSRAGHGDTVTAFQITVEVGIDPEAWSNCGAVYDVDTHNLIYGALLETDLFRGSRR